MWNGPANLFPFFQLQRVEQEELRTREANQAALAALVGGRKRARPDSEGTSSAPSVFASGKAGDAKSQVNITLSTRDRIYNCADDANQIRIGI